MKILNTITLWFGLIKLTAWTGLSAQAMYENGKPFLRMYTVKDYSGYHQNWCAAQDQNGLMYFANNNGVLQYDGVNWSIIPTHKRTTVRSLAVDSANRIYVGAQNEFGYLDYDREGRLEFRPLTDSLPEALRSFDDVWSTHATSQGVYFRCRNYLFRWHDNRLSVIRPSQRLTRSFLIRDTVYIYMESSGLYRVQDTSIIFMPQTESLKNQRVYVIIPYDDKLLIGTRNKGFLVYDGQKLIPLKTELDSYCGKQMIYCGEALSDGTFAIGFLFGGLAIMDRNGRVITMADKLSGLSEKVHYIMKDQASNLWLALDNGLAYVEWPSPFTVFDNFHGLEGVVQSVTRHEGRIVAATNAGVFHIEWQQPGGRLTRPMFQRTANITVQSFSLLSLPHALLCANQEGVLEIMGNKVTPLTKETSFLLYRSRFDSSIIFSGYKEGIRIFKYHGGRIINLGSINGLRTEIRSLTEDNNGALWAGSKYQGVWKIRWENEITLTPTFTHYDTLNGLSAGWTQAYFIDNGILVSTSTGLFRYQPDRDCFLEDTSFYIFNKKVREGLIPIITDYTGDIWMVDGSEIGIARKTRDDRWQFLTTPFKRLPKHINIVALYPEKDGTMWIGSTETIYRYNPRSVRSEQKPFKAFIRKMILMDSEPGEGIIYLDQKERHSRLVISAEQNNVQWLFSGIHFGSEEYTRYSYRLDGFDRKWSDWVKEPKKEYTNLPEGYYQFCVKAKNIYDIESEEDFFAFEVLPPWYRTWWAYTFYGVGMLIFVFGIIRWRSRVLMQRNLELEEKVLLRTQELQRAQSELIRHEKMASLGQMVAGIAHEINNPLGLIKGGNEFLENRVAELLDYTDSLRKAVEGHNLSSEIQSGLLRQAEQIEYQEAREDIRQTIREIIAGTTRIAGIVSNLKNFSNLDAMSWREINIQNSLDNIVDLFLSQYRDIRVIKDYGAVPPFWCLPGELHQSLINILQNAVQAVRDAEEKGIIPAGNGWITIKTETLNEVLHLSIGDNGIGMTEDIKAKIFDPFFTTRKVGAGKGLGLTEVYAAVEKHQGCVEVQSEPGKGTVFVLKIPTNLKPPDL